MKAHFLIALAAWMTLPSSQAGSIETRPFKVKAGLPDQAEALSPADVLWEGWLGNRVALNEKNRLVKVDLEPLLAGFDQKSGMHPWIGEHIGKWLHAATLAWANTGDPDLRRKLDYAAAELVKAQEPDGYLGTYVPEKRFGLYPGADWDVWSHKPSSHCSSTARSIRPPTAKPTRCSRTWSGCANWPGPPEIASCSSRS